MKELILESVYFQTKRNRVCRDTNYEKKLDIEEYVEFDPIDRC